MLAQELLVFNFSVRLMNLSMPGIRDRYEPVVLPSSFSQPDIADASSSCGFSREYRRLFGLPPAKDSSISCLGDLRANA
jgi:hypothetical protein